jgi:integrase
MPKLTQLTVENIRPGAARIEVPDSRCSGLYLVIQSSGAKSWAVRYRITGKPRKLTLDPAPGGALLTLAAAHKAAADALAKVAEGIDPAEQKRIRRETGIEAAASRAHDTVERLVDAFIERYCKPRNRSWKATEGYFRREVLPAWRGKSVHEIEREDVEDLVDRIAEDGRPVMANRVLAAVRKFFSWLIGPGRSSLHSRLKTGNPAAGIEPPAHETRRDRVLTNAEIVSLWKALDAEGGPFAQLVRVMLLTGQRRGEVAGMSRSEVDFDNRLWTMPSVRTKNRLPHVVPLSDQVASILLSMHEIAGSYMFTISGRKPVANFYQPKARLDKRMKPATPWTLHDLRRTCATGLGDIGVQPHIIEAALNHVSGHKRGVAGTYNRSAYAKEKTEALQRWADHVEGLVTSNPAKVVPLRRGAAVPA